MENSEVSSTATRTWHDFLDRMRQPSATDFVRSIKKFIVSLSNTIPDPEKDSASIQEFYGNMDTAFRVHPLWAGRTEEELDSASEGLEKYIMTKLYTRVFATHQDDVKIDNEFNKKSSLVQQFIQPEHLDIQPTYRNETSWLQAQKELQNINNYKAPRDKLSCILSFCKVISNSLLDTSVSAGGDPPGADDFFPVLIYVTIKANPPQFHSNLMYIQRYRNKLKLVGEAAYVFTNMLSAESFILNIDAKALSMDEAQFVENMKSAEILISGLDMQSQSGQRQNVSESKLKEVPSVSDLENKGASVLVSEESVIEKFKNFPYLYSKAEDLTIGDVEGLLNGYKQLVFKYVYLAKGLGAPVTLIGGGTTDSLEGKGSMEFDGDDVAGQVRGETVNASEIDADVHDDVRVQGDDNDGAGASTIEGTVVEEEASRI
ncbi:vacuolar protein sorting-associated protein 9A-like [Rutidosis leptorrhynchoides]|uniref:vacuolar protein sorting-associated protein 9A-like n=1 Tax=Rutidosis leptorrhynchoides TaxID=125765 RepID=UPI003A98CED5